MDTINERILKIRKECGLSQETFAERIGVTKSAISGYEIGRREPTLQIIKSICREFGVEEHWLQTGEGEMMRAEPEDSLEEMLCLYECSEFERSFFKAYFTELSHAERKLFSEYLNRVLGIAFGNMEQLERSRSAAAQPFTGMNFESDSDVAAAEAAYEKAFGIQSEQGSQTLHTTEDTRQREA